MQVIRKRTEELQQAIIRNPNLLKDLSQTVAEVIGEKIQLPENATYVFEKILGQSLNCELSPLISHPG